MSQASEAVARGASVADARGWTGGRTTGWAPSPRDCVSSGCSTSSNPCGRSPALAGATGFPMPTVYRLVMTLVGEGFLDQLPSGEYRPGVRTLTLGGSALRSLDLVGIATPLLQQLGADTGETVNLAVLVDDRILYLIRLRNSDLVTANIQVGSTLPAVRTSIGKLLLAGLSESEFESTIRRPRCSATVDPMRSPRSTNCDASWRRCGPTAGRSRTRSWPMACAPSPSRSSAQTGGSSPGSTSLCRRGSGRWRGCSPSSSRVLTATCEKISALLGRCRWRLMTASAVPCGGSARPTSTTISAPSTTPSSAVRERAARSCSGWSTRTAGWRARSTPSCSSRCSAIGCRRSAARSATRRRSAIGPARSPSWWSPPTGDRRSSSTPTRPSVAPPG